MDVNSLTNVVAIAAGRGHALAMKDDGTVVGIGWGAGTNVPTGLKDVRAISAGLHYSLALRSNGTVVAWGQNDRGQTSVPSGLSNVVAIAAGERHCLALKADGTVVAWGDNSFGQASIPSGLSGVVAISAGWRHSLALLGGFVPLNATRSGNKFILSWPANGTGFALQSTLQLTPPATWADVTNRPALLGMQWTVTNTFSGNAQFYRLRKL